MTIVPGLEQIEYYGRGPRENYWDRKASALIGLYQTTVADEYVSYIMPQENGHHTEVRWLSLRHSAESTKLPFRSEQGRGLHIEGSGETATLEFNASHFSDNDLYLAKHTYELKPRPEIILNLDIAMRGLGTASCGPDTLEQYKLLQKEYNFNYRLSLL
jgi:beta-galactosidase